MAFDGATPCWIPDIPFGETDAWRLKKAQFGDGYQQRMLDGINALERTWSLTWVNRESDVIEAMVAYLANLRAGGFDFKDPVTGVLWKVFCDQWEVAWNLRRKGGLYYGTLTAEFYRANGALLA